MYERILTVLDATPNAQAVLAQSLYLARLAEVSVHVLHVHSVRAMHAALPIVAAPVAGVPMLGVPPADMAVGAQAQWLVHQAVAQLVVAGVKTTGEVLDASEERTAEAIMGARHAAGGAVHRAGRRAPRAPGDAVTTNCRRAGVPLSVLSGSGGAMIRRPSSVSISRGRRRRAGRGRRGDVRRW
jgi:hypothetical protein